MNDLLLKYRILADEARTISSGVEWNKYAGALEKKPNEIYSISFINNDITNQRRIFVQEYPLVYLGIYQIIAPTPGGTIDIRSVKIKWPSGDAPLSVILHRVVDLHYIQIPIID